MNNLGYFIKESFDNLLTNKMVTLTTLITVILALIVTGAFQIVSVNMVQISSELGSNFEFNIFIRDSVSDSELPNLENQIKNMPNVKAIKLKTRIQTFNEVKERMGDASALKGLSLENNPFRNCFIITVTELSEAKETIPSIKSMAEVDSVADNLEASQQIDDLSNKVKIFSIISYVLLAILCLSIISNIINISIFARRKHINIMKYVGATDGFIKCPFIIEGMLIGFLGALIATGLLIYAYTVFHMHYNQVMGDIYLLAPVEVFKVVGILNSAYGIFVGAMGAGFAVNKHLKV